MTHIMRVLTGLLNEVRIPTPAPVGHVAQRFLRTTTAIVFCCNRIVLGVPMGDVSVALASPSDRSPPTEALLFLAVRARVERTEP